MQAERLEWYEDPLNSIAWKGAHMRTLKMVSYTWSKTCVISHVWNLDAGKPLSALPGHLVDRNTPQEITKHGPSCWFILEEHGRHSCIFGTGAEEKNITLSSLHFEKIFIESLLWCNSKEQDWVGIYISVLVAIWSLKLRKDWRRYVVVWVGLGTEPRRTWHFVGGTWKYNQRLVRCHTKRGTP